MAHVSVDLAASRLETNKATVLAFYEKVVNQRDFEGARLYLGPYYIQHNPDSDDGADGLKVFMEAMKRKFPHLHVEVKRVLADGDHVVLHTHVVREPGLPGSAHVDIFRLEHGKVVEHWDVDQPIPDKAVNPHGML